MRDLTLKVKPRDADWFEQELTRDEFSFVRRNFKTTVHLTVTLPDDYTESIVNWFIEARKRRDSEVAA